MTETQSTPNTPAPEATRTPPRKRRRRWLRWTLGIVAALVVLLVVFVVLLPTLLSTGPGTRFVAGRLGGQLDGTAELRDLSLGWGGPTTVIGASIYDADGRKVVELGELSTDAGLWTLITGGMRGELALGDTVIRGSLPVVELYPDGTTNLDRVFGTADADEESGDTTRVTGDLAIDLDMTVQRASGPPSDASRTVGTPVKVSIEDATVALGDDGSIANNLPIALRVGNVDAGRLSAVGTADPEAGAIDETITMTAVDLGAAALLVEAFDLAPFPYEAAGTLNGEFRLDSAAGTLAGGLTVDTFAVRPLDGGEGYANERLTLDLSGSFDQAANTATVDELRLQTDGDGSATLAAALDLPTEDRPAGPQSLRDISIDVDTPYLTVRDSGPAASIGGLDLALTADLDAIQQRFSGLIGDDVTVGGAVDGTVKTRVNGASIQGAIRLNGSDVRYADAGGEEGARRELSLDAMSLFVVPTLQPADDSLELVSLLVRADAEDAGGPLVSLDSMLSEITPPEDEEGQTSIGSIQITKLEVPDAQRFGRAFGDFAELPELESNPGPIVVTGTLAWDGEASLATVAAPLAVSVAGATVAQVESLDFATPAEGESSVDVTASLPDLAAAKPLLVALGSLKAEADAPTGGAIVTFSGTFDAEEALATLDGEGLLKLADVVAMGASASGNVPLRASGGVVRVPDDAAPLVANDGQLAIASLALNLDTLRLTGPAGSLATGVNLNPVLLDALGQFVHPVLTEPQEAGGLLDVRLDGPLDLNLSDPFGPEGGTLAITFNIREFRVDNDVIGEVAQAVADQAATIAGVEARTLRSIPGLGGEVDKALARLNLEQEVRDEISSLRGSVPDSEFRLDRGVASTRVTFNVADPRASADASEADKRYALTFAGAVNVQTLAVDLSTTVPTNLVEKWLGENPDYLADYLGERPIRRIMPDGFTLALGGTTRRPTVDAVGSLNQIIPRAVNAAVERQTGDLLNDPGKAIDRLRGLFD